MTKFFMTALAPPAEVLSNVFGARLFALAAVLALTATPVPADTFNWTNTATSGNWTTASNWSNNLVPTNGPGDAVNLNANFTAKTTLTLDTSAVVGIMIYGDSSGSAALYLTNTGGSTLTFDNNGSASTLTFQGGQANVYAPIRLANDLYMATPVATYIYGDISSSSSGLKTITNSTTVTYLASISDGSGSVALYSKNGILTLNSSSSFSGGVTVDRGSLTLGDSNALGTGELLLTNVGTIALNVTTNMTVTNSIRLGAANVQGGTNTLTWSGPITQTANSTLNRAGTTEISGEVYLSGSSGTGGTLALGGNGSISGVIANYNGVGGTAGNITKAGTGTWTLSGNNTYSGGTLISAGTLRIGAGGTTGSVAGNITNNASLVLDRSDAWTVTNVISGTGAVTKSGAGTLTLTASNSYTGATTVSNGTLAVNGSIASATTVQDGATLAGSGSVGSTIVNANATIAPGNSPGKLTINGDLTWKDGGAYDWEVFRVSGEGTAGTDWDLLDVTNSLVLSDLTGSPMFNINLLSLSATNSAGALANWSKTGNYSWQILSASNAIANFNTNYFNINTAGFSAYNDISGGSFKLELGDNDKSLFLTYTGGGAPIPEPGTWAAAALLASGAGLLQWRRRAEKKKG